MASPTTRTLNRMRDDGYLCAVVEKWIPIPTIPGGGKRKDMFGIIDVVAIRPNEIIGIQCCAGSGFSKHVQKLTIAERYRTKCWLEAGGQLQIWGWRKLAKRKDNKLWHPKIRVITLQDLRLL